MGVSSSYSEPPRLDGPSRLDTGIKVAVHGHPGSGKTHLIDCYVHDGRFVETPTSLVGPAYQIHRATVDSRTMKLEIWDSDHGDRRFLTPLRPSWYNNAVAIVVYDITSVESFQVAQRWANELKVCTPNNNLLLVLVGSKSDLESQRAVNSSKAEAFLRDTFPETRGTIQPLFFECSAKSGANVTKLFERICRTLIRLHGP
ncbi:Rab family GTPase [Pelomyxa schiedti]|nr:Rab family GTPase [Pelomyxa schiedti]